MELILAAAATGQGTQVEAGGLTGWVIDVVRAIGELGVGLLVLLENVVPPIPSEVVLPFSGALVTDGRFTFVGVLIAATIGSVLGAVLLYELGRRLGQDRVERWLAKIPLVRRDDIEKGDDWFARHGRVAVFTGRMVPGVRSVVSIPAGAQAMPRGTFLLLTTLGTLLWNSLLIGAGVLLGQQWQTVEQYTKWLDVAMIAVVVYAVGRLVWRRVTEGDQPQEGAGMRTEGHR